MSKYIDADKLDKEFNEILDNPKEYDKPIHDMLREFYFAPTEDVEPVRHGAWKEILAGMDHEYECTRCKACVEQIYPYCPNCGAKMDGEEQEYESSKDE